MVNVFGGGWTREKLLLLEGYLNSYTTVMKRNSFYLWYVDAFAGTGYVNLDSGSAIPGQLQLSQEGWDSDSTNVLRGSTRLAIEVDNRSFDEFIFIEQNIQYAAELAKVKLEFQDRNIEIAPTDANVFLRDWCTSRNQQLGTPWQGERAVIFLDPYATEVDWQTVQRIAETKSVDLWILFPLYALSRILPNERVPENANAAKLDRVFGDQEWQNALYRTYRQPNLFGDEETHTIREEQQAIVDLYLRKLKGIFPSVAPSPKWFCNSRNSPLFAFMFAAANPGRGGEIALQIANHLLTRW